MLEIHSNTPEGTAFCTLGCASNIPVLFAEAARQNVHTVTVTLGAGVLFNVPGLEFIGKLKYGNMYMYNQRRYRIKLLVGEV